MGIRLRCFNFYFRVTGEKAEQLLNEYGDDGDFLARYSESSPSNFSLTIRISNRLIHIKIQKNQDSVSIFDGTSQGTIQFSSIVELLEFYIENPTKLQEKSGGFVQLRKPVYIPFEIEECAKEQRLVQMNRWFHCNITATEAISFLEREKPGAYLVRFSQHCPGSLVISAKTETSVVHLSIHQAVDTGRYTIDGDRTEYCDIRQLIATYHKNPIVEKASSSRVVYLQYPITNSSTFIPADIISDRLELLKQSLEPGKSKTGITEEFERLQAEQGPAEQLFSKRAGRREINVDKNRYKNIVPFDHTRVVLKDKAGIAGSDYINASYVKFDQPNPALSLVPVRNYIATQGCLESTIPDFWRMIWQEDSRVIVMPTRENERREKCSRYWPELNDTVVHSEISITTTEEKKVRKQLPDELKNEQQIHDDDDEVSYIVRTFNIKKLGSPASRIVRHLQYVCWPDHGCPYHPHEVISFLETVDATHKQFETAEVQQGPVVVHCSAGIGRTGTFMLLDVLLTQIKIRGRGCPIDVWKTAKHARNFRGGLVQTEQQYQFLYTALAYYVKKTNKCPEQRLVIRERGASSSVLPLTTTSPSTSMRVPDVAQAFIGPSGQQPPSTSPLPPRSRSRNASIPRPSKK
ncbi:unnamed protein product [Caenorhabditis angaria]|uniref:protein-tyrosine-phosphatase n=1 Tax=Caenorhabditis angaria TaxID=860376 RepID=A0A9P1ID78_9PELO|nr:unnamed protein product [Caenorhabditis angaria]